jgi:hypothetical protein
VPRQTFANAEVELLTMKGVVATLQQCNFHHKAGSVSTFMLARERDGRKENFSTECRDVFD